MKKTFLPVIIVLALLAFPGCSRPKSSADMASAPSYTPAQIVSSKVESSSSAQASAAAAVVYDICGESNKLSSAAWEKMQQWRAEAKAFGEKYPAAVLLNDQPQSNTVYLTFDDGPDDVITPKVVDILAENNVCGNFFFIGKEISKHRDVVQRAYDNQNYVGSHCMTHRRLTELSSEEIRKELSEAGDAIKEITGAGACFVRPPFGAINDSVIADFEALNLKAVLWSIDTLDWSQRDVSNIVKNVTDHLRPGGIILMHSNGDKAKTAKALPQIIEAIQEKGYSFGTFHQLQQ